MSDDNENKSAASGLAAPAGSRLVARLRELSDAVTKGESGRKEFDMRIPADPERDADLVLQSAADKIEELEAALCDIAVMPHIDQDDAHRLRNKAYVALGVKNPAIHSENTEHERG